MTPEPNIHPAYCTASSAQVVVAVAHSEAACRRPCLDCAGVVVLAHQRRRPRWGDPQSLAQLELDLRACGAAVISCHPLADARHWRTLEDAYRRTSLTALAYAARAHRTGRSLDPALPQPGDRLQ
jgi:hypothetical protein